ncbi:hypothetical protein AA313_de0200290 [Arthrobotrys entomopaga]|nr:hypothetical protein AA313_de0200290 [Arthrobotrys entomopaga]
MPLMIVGPIVVVRNGVNWGTGTVVGTKNVEVKIVRLPLIDVVISTNDGLADTDITLMNVLRRPLIVLTIGVAVTLGVKEVMGINDSDKNTTVDSVPSGLFTLVVLGTIVIPMKLVVVIKRPLVVNVTGIALMIGLGIGRWLKLGPRTTV